MLNFARRALVAATLAASTALALPATAQDVTLRLGHVAPPQTTYQQAAERFAANLGELSGGTMAVDVVPGGALGNLGQLWVQTRAGALDLHLIDVGAMIAMQEARQFLVLWLPFLFEDQDHFRRYMASETFERMMGEVEAATDIVFLGLAGDRPPRALTTADTPVTTPADLAGLKIRTPEHPMIVGAFEAWGAAPTPLPASELFTALRTGLADGQDNGVLDFVGAGYAEVQSHYMPLDYIHSGIGIWMGGPSWSGLTPEQQGWLREAAEMAGMQGAEIHDADMADALASLEGLGVTVTQPDLDAFRPVAEGMRADMEGGAWPEGLAAEIGGL
jgi:TRAP-type C4-dicarboxylate transport system substrate-binding protein